MISLFWIAHTAIEAEATTLQRAHSNETVRSTGRTTGSIQEYGWHRQGFQSELLE